jgi:hypothetical protein
MEEKNAFYSRLYDMKEKLGRNGNTRRGKHSRSIQRETREMASFYSWKKIDDHFRINIKKNAVSQRVNRMGQFSTKHK